MPLPDGTFLYGAALTPIVWSQDTLVTPAGYGKMPDVDAVNANIGREYFSYTGKFNAGAATAANSYYNETVTLFKDGDFWISSFAVSHQGADGALSSAQVGELTVTDNMNGYNFFTPSISTQAVDIRPFIFNNPTVAVSLCDWIEPYCVLRGGSLTLTLTTGAFGSGGALSFAFNGWKEYRHAAR